MFTRNNIFFLLALFYTLYLIFPLFADMVRVPVWLPSIATSALMFLMFPKAFRNKVMYWFMVYAFMLLLFVMMGKPLTIGIGTVLDNKKILIEFAYILPALSIFSVFYYLKDVKLTRNYVKWSTILLFLSFIVALPLMNRYNSLREALLEQGEDLFIPGLPGYSLMHAYTLFLPSLCYAIRLYSGKRKIIAILALLLLCFVIYDTFVTTSLIIMIGILLFLFTYNEKRTTFFWILILITLLFFYYCYLAGYFVEFIDWIRPLFTNTPVEQKLEDIRLSIVEGQLKGGSITGRQHLHSISWNSFLTNPLWGTSIVGGHSSLLDRFGGMGVLGGVPFIMIFIYFYKRFISLFRTNAAKAFFRIGVVCSFVFLYEKGIWGPESWLMLMVMMPMTIWALERKHYSVGGTK